MFVTGIVFLALGFVMSIATGVAVADAGSYLNSSEAAVIVLLAIFAFIFFAVGTPLFIVGLVRKIRRNNAAKAAAANLYAAQQAPYQAPQYPQAPQFQQVPYQAPSYPQAPQFQQPPFQAPQTPFQQMAQMPRQPYPASQQPGPQIPDDQPPAAQGTTCPACGAAIPENVSFCPNCGAPKQQN